jgi:DNA-binding LytR/AlgR family response regulator
MLRRGAGGRKRSTTQTPRPSPSTRNSSATSPAIEQVAYFVSADKLSFAVATDGTRLLVDAPLADVERELDPQRFFRGKGRIALQLAPGTDGEWW